MTWTKSNFNTLSNSWSIFDTDGEIQTSFRKYFLISPNPIRIPPGGGYSSETNQSGKWTNTHTHTQIQTLISYKTRHPHTKHTHHEATLKDKHGTRSRQTITDIRQACSSYGTRAAPYIRRWENPSTNLPGTNNRDTYALTNSQTVVEASRPAHNICRLLA